MKLRKSVNLHQGFTVLELLTVVAVIAVLAFVSMPLYQAYVRRSQASEILAFFDELRTDLNALSINNTTSSCADVLDYIGESPDSAVTDHYARVSIGFEAVNGVNLNGYQPVLRVCAREDLQGELGVGVAQSSYEQFAAIDRVNTGAILEPNLVSFTARLTDNEAAYCKVPTGGTLTACGTPAAVPVQQPLVAPSQVSQAAPVAPNMLPAGTPQIVPGVDRVDLMRDITGATALSSYAGLQRGVAIGTQIVGMYMAGSAVNQLAGIGSGQLPRVDRAYTNVDDAGYQYLAGSGDLGRLMPTLIADLQPLRPDQRNGWDGGIIVFSDGSVGRMLKAANGNGSERDYVYFQIIDGVNANDGMAIVHGHAQPGQQVAVSAGGTSLGTVTADAQGNWNLAGAAALAAAGQNIEAVPVVTP